jgi:hypothetical protein
MPLATTDEPTAMQDFRVTQLAYFRQLRMCVLLDELLFLSGERTLQSLLIELSEPAGRDNQIGAWHARLRGEYLPRPKQIDLLKRRYPGLRVDLHNPAWCLLAHPHMSPRSRRRMMAKMPEQWHQAHALLRELPTTRLSVQPSLPEALQLHRLNFLDALLLFWCERERASADGLKDRSTALDQILWLLPVLYPLDPLWARAEHYQYRHRLMLDAIDRALHLTGEECPSNQWSWCRREAMIFDQQWHLQDHMKKYPQGLRTVKERMRYFSRVWYWRPHQQPSEQRLT